MWRLVTSTFLALTFASSVATAQQPCSTDAARVVAEVYRHSLERGVDAGARGWQDRLASGQMTVRELVRAVAKSDEYMNRFGRTEAGEGQPFERAVARLYRHILARQPDPEGQRTWANTAQQQGLAAVVDALVNSQEYSNNFGDWGVPGSGGMTFCAPNNAQTSSVTQEQGPLSEVRFRGMDRNRDGVVSRDEWRGSAQSFRVHDWDGNGVLSGDEVRQGAFRRGRTIEDEDFDRGDEFAYLDTNRNNRIDEQEWHASLDAFRRLDRNRDRVVSRAEYDAYYNPNNASSVGTTGDVIVVNPRQRWVDTGIDVQAGDTVSVDADGQVRLSDNPGDNANATGAFSGRRAANAPVPSAPAGGLIARIGNSAPVYVGDRRTVRAPRAGRLYLGVNDDFLDDNRGEFRVNVDVR